MFENKKYPAQVFYSDEDEGFIATVPDLPGCSAFGETQEEALQELQDAIVAWKAAALKAGNAIPAPSRPTVDPLPSGKFLVRAPRSLHAQLIEHSKYEGVSLNQYVVTTLAAGISADIVREAMVSQIADMKHSLTLFGMKNAGVGQVMMVYMANQFNVTAQTSDPLAVVQPISRLISFSERGETIHG